MISTTDMIVLVQIRQTTDVFDCFFQIDMTYSFSHFSIEDKMKETKSTSLPAYIDHFLTFVECEKRINEATNSVYRRKSIQLERRRIQ